LAEGHMLDTLARTALWDVGLDYPHGTGHGVGAFLNVHEGEVITIGCISAVTKQHINTHESMNSQEATPIMHTFTNTLACVDTLE